MGQPQPPWNPEGQQGQQGQQSYPAEQYGPSGAQPRQDPRQSQPGLYPDPAGQQVLRWWDGTAWTPDTQPMPVPPPGAVIFRTGPGPGGQPQPAGHQQQSGPQDGTAYPVGLGSDPYPASFPAALPQQPDPYQPQGPQDPYQPVGWPQQQADAPGPQPQPRRPPRRPRKRRTRSVLIGLGTLIAIIVAIIVAIGVASGHGNPASSAPAAPRFSAAAACHDFGTWFLGTGGEPATLKGIATLRRAVSEAPSGTLYQDMSTLLANVQTAAGQGGGLGQAEAGMVTVDASQVEQDCQTVNPDS